MTTITQEDLDELHAQLEAERERADRLTVALTHYANRHYWHLQLDDGESDGEPRRLFLDWEPGARHSRNGWEIAQAALKSAPDAAEEEGQANGDNS